MMHLKFYFKVITDKGPETFSLGLQLDSHQRGNSSLTLVVVTLMRGQVWEKVAEFYVVVGSQKLLQWGKERMNISNHEIDGRTGDIVSRKDMRIWNRWYWTGCNRWGWKEFIYMKEMPENKGSNTSLQHFD